jgi:hypothetical protein
MSALALVEPVSIPADTTPVDPESLDATRPADLDVCPVCHGDRAVLVAVDPVTGEADAEECSACAGTGQRGAA